MEHDTSNQRDLLVDLEGGGTTSEEDTNNDHILGNGQAEKLLTRVVGGVLCSENSETDDRCSLNSYSSLGNFCEAPPENIQLLIDKGLGGRSGEHVPFVEKKHVKKKPKAANFKKAAKPPRPPRGPSLDAADLKLVKEISELAMKKHARIERMKAVKKMKAAKSSSTSSSISCLPAMIVTLLFCLIIIFQGLLSRDGSTVSVLGSPEPAAATNGFISVRLYNNPLHSDNIGPSSESPNSVERISGLESRYPE